MLLLAGLNELVAIAFTTGWRWLHGVLGVLFIITGFMALVEPLQTFGILALLVGWYLMLKGIADIVVSIADRQTAAPLGSPARRRDHRDWPSACGRSGIRAGRHGC